MSAADPAMCGLDIDVPAIDWNSSPCGPDGMPTWRGDAPARIWTPGAVMSGLLTPSDWAGPPRELNDAMTSPCWLPLTPSLRVAMTFVWLPMKASSVWPWSNWMWLAGRKWLSVSWSVTVASVL